MEAVLTLDQKTPSLLLQGPLLIPRNQYYQQLGVKLSTQERAIPLVGLGEWEQNPLLFFISCQSILTVHLLSNCEGLALPATCPQLGNWTGQRGRKENVNHT